MTHLDDMLARYNVKLAPKKETTPDGKRPDLVENMLRHSHEDRVNSIRDNITDIENMIKHREELSVDTIRTIDLIIDEVDKVLLGIKGYEDGNPRLEPIDLKKEMLRKKYEMLQSKVNEKVDVWNDVAALRKEMRELFKELRDLESKSGILENLMTM